ncbi:MAG: hypothetical protein K0S37_3609 [Microbacterium sp.]|nr:hypothetical protein [Microbacterium sp.]
MTTIPLALHDLLNDRETPLEVAIDRHFTPDYRQRTDGAWADRTAFTAHIAHLRGRTSHVSVEVLHEVSAGNAYAEHHRIEVEKTDGTRTVQEVYLFAERAADGRFAVIDETTLMISGTEEDRSLGRAR